MTKSTICTLLLSAQIYCAAIDPVNTTHYQIYTYTSDHAPETCNSDLSKKYSVTVILLMNTHGDSYIGEARIIHLSQKHCYLDQLYIEPAYRNKGYGSYLFQLVKTYCINQKALVISWHATSIDLPQHERYPQLPRLVHFYEQVGAQRSFHNDTQDNPYMGMYLVLAPINRLALWIYRVELWLWFKYDRLYNVF